jgi:methanogenic corrinoid protein MtbC1
MRSLIDHAFAGSTTAPGRNTRGAVDRATPPGMRRIQPIDVEHFLTVLTGPDESRAERYVQDLLSDGAPLERVYLDLFAPAAARLGELWDDDACDFLQVTDALGRMHKVLHVLEPCWLHPPEGKAVGRVLLACPAGEQHTLGLFIVAEFFARDNWDVRVGPPLDRVGLLDAVRDESFDVVGFSVGCASKLPRLAHDIGHLRRASSNPDLLVLVGGPPFARDPGLAARVGADGTAPSADAAPLVARQLRLGRGVQSPPPV